jgi:hypothetical protein
LHFGDRVTVINVFLYGTAEQEGVPVNVNVKGAARKDACIVHQIIELTRWINERTHDGRLTCR